MTLFIRAVLVAGTMAPLVGCGRDQARVTPVYDPETNRLVRLDYDYDADGRVDVRTFMKDGRPERLEGDADRDGKTDRWEYYDDKGAVLRVGGSTAHDGVEDTWAYGTGDDVRVEVSTHRNGIVDRREFYRQNRLLRVESDTNLDGLLDTWEQYENGRLAVLLLDDTKTQRQPQGRPTRRLVYDGSGTPRVEVDPKGEGVFVPAVASRAGAAEGSAR
jgi:hypothetical protein